MKKIASISTGLLITTVIIAQPVKPLSQPVKVTSVEGITEYRLPNGLRVLIFPDPSKATATVNITYLVGSRMEGYGETGMAHLLEHMVFKGSTNHKNIPQELSAHGARPNGTTWYDRTNYYETFAATEENLRWALSLESDRMVNSFIDKKDLETEFSVVRNEFERGENNPAGVLEERVMSTAYLWHNYGKSTIGSKEDIEKVPIENLKAFYRKYYQPDNAVLTVTGKIDEIKTIALVNEYFGKIPRSSKPVEEPYTMEPIQDGERQVVLRRVGDVQVVGCGYHIPPGSHSDFAAVRVLNDVLTNEPSGRLYKALIETKKASSIHGYAYALKDPGYVYYSTEVLKENSIDEAMAAMMNVFDGIKYTPVTEEEVNRAKTKLVKDMELLLNKSERVGLTLSEYIAQGDWRLLFLYRDQLEKVTVADVNRVALAYFKPSNRTIGRFFPDPNPDRAEIPAPPDVKALVKDYKGKPALAMAEAFDASPSNIDNRTVSGQFKGGAKYSLLKKSTRGNSVNATIVLRIGSEATLQDKGTLASLTASMLNKGTKQRSRKEINDEWDKLKARVRISGGGQTLTVSIETVKDKLSEVLQLVNEILRQPSFPADEFDKLRQEKLAEIEQNKSEPGALASNMYSRLVNPYPKNDFRYVMTFDEEIAALKNTSIENLKKFYEEFYQSENASAAVVGEFEEKETATQLGAILEFWRAPNKYERAKGSHFNISSKTEKINTPDKANANMMAGFNIEMSDDDPDYPALTIGNYMLGGGFLNSRLATRIRQKEGISYGVGSWISADPLDKSGGFGSYAIYNPDNNDRLLAAYKEEIERVAKSGFTADELKDAKSGFLQRQDVSRSQDDFLSTKLASNLYYNRTMNWSEEFESKIKSLTTEQVNAAMAKWIKIEKICFVLAGDFERKTNAGAKSEKTSQ